MNPFTDHPRASGETYFSHAWFALRFGGHCLLAGGAALIHGFLPFVFTTTSSSIIKKLCRQLDSR